jgi:hypothetical protein
MAVLADVLARDATDLAATEYQARQRSNADHLGQLHAIWMDLTERADAERFRPLVQPVLAGTWAIGNGALDTPTARWLYRTMRSAELAGADPGAVVRQAVQSRDLNGARDIPAVIDARMRPSVNAMAPRPAARWADRVPQAANPEIRDHLGKLAMLVDERRERIGQHAAQHQSARAVKALGPAPGDPGERDRWRERASAVGAYREQASKQD